MTPKIDDKTLIPITWAASSFLVLLSCATYRAFWLAEEVTAVNFRLTRIEQTLKIPGYAQASSGEAVASEIGGYDNGLSKRVSKLHSDPRRRAVKTN